MTGLLNAIAFISTGAAATSDALRGRIPNALTFPVILGALVLHAITGEASFIMSVLGLVIAAGIPWTVYRATHGQAIGGGDVKLFAALGALLGSASGLEAELSSFLLLGVYAILRLAFEGRLLGVLVNAGFLFVNPLLPERHRRSIVPEVLTPMRLGPAIFLAVIVVVLADHVRGLFPWI